MSFHSSKCALVGPENLKGFKKSPAGLLAVVLFAIAYSNMEKCDCVATLREHVRRLLLEGASFASW